MNWYKFTPADTLFIKGAEPMSMGENHTASHVFPPPAHTISGALRTAVLLQNQISFSDYRNGKTPDSIINSIGKAGQPAPFNLMGPIFIQKGGVYIPAPYSWFIEKTEDAQKESCNLKVIKAKLINSNLVKSHSQVLLWAKGEKNEMKSIGGMWLRIQDLYSSSQVALIKTNKAFFEDEPRTGIALEKNRKAREGHLYSFTHSRLKKDTCLLFGTDLSLPLDNNGVLRLGGEQRFGWYESLADNGDVINFTGEGEYYMSLSVVEGSEESNASVVCTGKILYFGGWDLNTGFHKPMKGFYPAGTVFNKKLKNCIAIKGVKSC